MNQQEIYEGLRVLVRAYIIESKQNELIDLLNRREAEGSFPPGKGILASISSDSNGLAIKSEHKELWDDICHHCV